MASPQFEFLIPGWLAYTFALVKAWSDIQRHEGPGVASMATFYISASHLVMAILPSDQFPDIQSKLR